MIQIGVILVGVDVIQIDVIINVRTFAPNFFKYKIILATSVFFNTVTFNVFNFTYLCTMP